MFKPKMVIRAQNIIFGEHRIKLHQGFTFEATFWFNGRLIYVTSYVKGPGISSPREIIHKFSVNGIRSLKIFDIQKRVFESHPVAVKYQDPKQEIFTSFDRRVFLASMEKALEECERI